MTIYYIYNNIFRVKFDWWWHILHKLSAKKKKDFVTKISRFYGLYLRILPPIYRLLGSDHPMSHITHNLIFCPF